MNKKLVERIKWLFFEKLKEKTGWGRNDIMEVYNSCVYQAVMELLDEKES